MKSFAVLAQIGRRMFRTEHSAFCTMIVMIFVLSFCLCACGKPRHLTFEEQQAYMAKQQCAQEASNMNPEWPNSSNPFWSDYFVMCMHQLGVSNAALRRMWY